ncbi:Odr-4p [Parelaphostrongylus tenuis]|uniref:Odr-4p n=1 Tax=Parelaphostrongylus tenuis TaxID=148309 RepID=A0AAD5R5U1_PARTN|nr:Odr-4p [Parelaphostrongylus tenuis]
MRDESEQLFKDVKKKKIEPVEVEVFVDACENKENTCEPQSATNLHEVSFDIEIRAAIPVKSKVGFAVAAVKQHLVRSLTARAELQYESMDVVEDAATSLCSVHQMPRSATTMLNTHPAIVFSDYLFEADTAEDAQNNFNELLGLKADKEHIDECWERCLEIDEMEVVRAPLDDTPIVNLKPKDGDITSTWSLLIALSVIIAVVSIVVYLL